MKEDSAKYLKALFVRAVQCNNILCGMPEQRYYETGSQYFLILEKRNEYLNCSVKVLKEEYGISLKELRVHQRNARDVFYAIMDVLKKEETQVMEKQG